MFTGTSNVSHVQGETFPPCADKSPATETKVILNSSVSKQEKCPTVLWTGFLNNKDKNSAEGVIAPAGAKVTGATIRMWLLNKFISFLAVLTWKTGLKKM